jgi:hypothetical protein
MRPAAALSAIVAPFVPSGHLVAFHFKTGWKPPIESATPRPMRRTT